MSGHHMLWCTCGSQRTTCKWDSLSPRDQTQIFKLGGKSLLPTEPFHKRKIYFLKSYATDLNPGVSLGTKALVFIWPMY